MEGSAENSCTLLQTVGKRQSIIFPITLLAYHTEIHGATHIFVHEMNASPEEFRAVIRDWFYPVRVR
jgi:hypothetical protein